MRRPIAIVKANRILGTDYKRSEWASISKNHLLSEDFICKFQNYLEWDYITLYQKLSEDFIRDYKTKVSWWNISTYQNLSESFIREFQDYVNWFCISSFQKLSEDFIREFQDKVKWKFISRYQKLSNKFKMDFQDKLSFNEIIDSWHYKTTEEKKQAVVETGLYECYNDYFIAYKGIRADRYSCYNFQYRYEKGQTYETWCDCSDTENSFGFSAWTEQGAYTYCNKLVVRVKINYEDVGRVVHKGGKIRCFKMTILD